MTPENGPLSFGAFEKRPPGTKFVGANICPDPYKGSLREKKGGDNGGPEGRELMPLQVSHFILKRDFCCILSVGVISTNIAQD